MRIQFMAVTGCLALITFVNCRTVPGFRTKTPIADGRNESEPIMLQVGNQERQAILHALFPGEWKGKNPELKGAVRGSFTRKGANEVFAIGFKEDLSLGQAGGLGRVKYGVFSSKGILEIQGDQTDIGMSPFRAIDLQRDGIQEILIGSGSMHQGHQSEGVSVVCARDNRIVELIGFPTSASDAATGNSTFDEYASKIDFIGGDPSRKENYEIVFFYRRIAEGSPRPEWRSCDKPWW